MIQSRNKQKILKRCCALLLALAVLFAVSLSPAAQTEAQIQAEMREIETRIAEQREVVAQLRAEAATYEALLPAMDAEVRAVEEMVTLIQNDVNTLNTSITDLNDRIRDLNESIEASAALIDEINEETEVRMVQIRELQEQLMERLRQQYISGPVSNLQLVLSSADLSALITVSEFIVRQADYDAQLRGDLEAEMARMLYLQQQLQTQQALYEGQREELREENRTLAEQVLRHREEQERLNVEVRQLANARAEVQEIIDGLNRNSRAAQQIIQREQQALDEAQRRINSLVNERISAGEIRPPQHSGRMIWPFPHHGCFITSRFGAHESFRAQSHRGVDISIANNWRTDWRVVAALCGVIADFGFNGSMGNYVVIYHGHFAPVGGRIQTVYMHFHSFAPGLRRGMAVSAGQHIGMMGNTGFSTGPHLHFQIDVFNAQGGRTSVDPMRFVSGAPYLRARR